MIPNYDSGEKMETEGKLTFTFTKSIIKLDCLRKLYVFYS